MIFLDISGTTSTDEEETIDLSVGDTGCCLLLCQGEDSVPVLQERIWILDEKYFVIIVNH